MIANRTSSRGILFEANSGWGKSSLVLTTAARLLENGHYVIAFDCRSASSTQFILKFVEHVLKKFGNFDGALPKKPIQQEEDSERYPPGQARLCAVG